MTEPCKCMFTTCAIVQCHFSNALSHARLTVFYIRLLRYDIIIATVQFSYGFSTTCIGYNTMVPIGFDCVIALIQFVLLSIHFAEKPWLNRRVKVTISQSDGLIQCIPNRLCFWNTKSSVSWVLAHLNHIFKVCILSISGYMHFVPRAELWTL